MANATYFFKRYILLKLNTVVPPMVCNALSQIVKGRMNYETMKKITKLRIHQHGTY